MIASELGTPLFSSDVTKLNDDQLQLIAWCRFYHNLYSLPESERPSDETIEDDEELDRWLKQRMLKNRQDSLKNKTSSAGTGESFSGIG